MDTLRDEVLNSQSVRSDLLKWKLVIVGALGAAGLGLAGSTATGHADLVLCAVPLSCLYVDLLCRHLSLRILVIGTFLRSAEDQPSGSGLAAYESYVEKARRLPSGEGNQSAFALEDWAVSWSTGLLSVAVLAYGIGVLLRAADQLQFAIPFILSGIVGAAITVAAQIIYRQRFGAVTALSVDRPTTIECWDGT